MHCRHLNLIVTLWLNRRIKVVPWSFVTVHYTEPRVCANFWIRITIKKFNNLMLAASAITSTKLYPNLSVNSLIPGIYITFKIKKRVIEFLDTLVYTVRDPNNPEVKIIKTRVYFKPTDTHQLLHATSFQPSHTTHGILKSQLLRFKRISHCYSDYSSACRILFDVLQHRGYSRTHFRIMKFHVWYTESSLKRDVGAER